MILRPPRSTLLTHSFPTRRSSDHRRVVVGQPDWETPQLSSAISRLVANPTWTVPKSIERSEMAAKGANYLRRNNMVRRDGWIVQLPGPDNVLGQVKFDMRNRSEEHTSELQSLMHIQYSF